MNFKPSFLFLLLIIAQGCSLFGSSGGDSDDGSKEDIDEGFGADFGEMELFSEAMRSYDAERYSVSRNMFNKLVGKYPSSPLSVFAELKIADSIFYSDKYLDSIPYYREFIRLHTNHEAIPYSHYQIAQAYLLSYQGIGHDVTPLKEAKKTYQKIVDDYPASHWAVNSEEQILLCDSHLFDSEMAVIKFYEKKGQEAAARARLDAAKSNFSHLEVPSADTPKDPDTSPESDENPAKLASSHQDKEAKEVKLPNIKFLTYALCESDEERTVLHLNFSSTAFLLRSAQVQKPTSSQSSNYQNNILIADNIRSNTLSDISDFSALGENAKNVETEVNFKVCGSSLDRLYLYEFAIKNSEDIPENYLALTFDSKVKRRVQMINGKENTDTSSLKIIFE